MVNPPCVDHSQDKNRGVPCPSQIFNSFGFLWANPVFLPLEISLVAWSNPHFWLVNFQLLAGQISSIFPDEKYQFFLV